MNSFVTENRQLRENNYAEAILLLSALKEQQLICENMTVAEWRSIVALVNFLYAGLMERMKSDYLSLTKNDVMLICLLVLGFSIKELSFALDAKECNTVLKAKQRLKRRLNISKDDSLREFIGRYLVSY